MKVEDKVNGDNLDTIYINGNANSIHTKLVGGLSLKSLSRRFDIEMKDVYLYVYNREEGYDKVKTEIPMLFVQNDYIASFGTDFYEKNKQTGATSSTDIIIPQADKTYMFSKYSELIDEYTALKEQVTYKSIKDYISVRDVYFN